MTTTTTTINSWVDSMRPHWSRCLGNVHNDTKFWNECIHSLSDKHWHTVIDFYAEHRTPDVDRKYTYLNEDLFVIAKRLDTGEKITIPFNKTGYNKPVFRATMAIKDIACKISGRPMLDQEIKPVKKSRPSREEVLAKYEELGRVIDSLFE